MLSLSFPNICILPSLSVLHALLNQNPSRDSTRIVNAVKAAAEAAEDFAPGRSAGRREVVDSNAIADQRHHGAEPHHAAIGQIGDVDRQEIDRWRRGDRTAAAANHDLQRHAGFRGGPRITIAIAERNQRQPRTSLGTVLARALLLDSGAAKSRT